MHAHCQRRSTWLQEQAVPIVSIPETTWSAREGTGITHYYKEQESFMEEEVTGMKFKQKNEKERYHTFYLNFRAQGLNIHVLSNSLSVDIHEEINMHS